MKEGLLADSTDYATKTIRSQIKSSCRLNLTRWMLICYIGTAQKADQVFLPVLENASKAQKLRSTLGVFERSKFFFNLPGSLMESIEAVSGSYCTPNKHCLNNRTGQI